MHVAAARYNELHRPFPSQSSNECLLGQAFSKYGNFPLGLNVTLNVQAAVFEPDAAHASPRSY